MAADAGAADADADADAFARRPMLRSAPSTSKSYSVLGIPWAHDRKATDEDRAAYVHRLGAAAHAPHAAATHKEGTTTRAGSVVGGVASPAVAPPIRFEDAVERRLSGSAKRKVHSPGACGVESGTLPCMRANCPGT